MGIAPPVHRHPAMPDPDRLVRSSVRVLKHLGMTQEQALETIIGVAKSVRFRLYGTTSDQFEWLTRIIRIAEDRLEVPKAEHTDRKGSTDADRASSRASGKKSTPEKGKRKLG